MLSVRPALFGYLQVCYLIPRQAWLHAVTCSVSHARLACKIRDERN